MRSYIQLLLTSVRTKNGNGGRRSVVVVFTAAEPGAGVSYVVNSFATELAQRTSQSVLVADAGSIQKAAAFHPNRVGEYCQQVDLPNLFLFLSEEELPVVSGANGQLQLRAAGTRLERGLKNLRTLRSVFDFVLVDCSALSVSGDAPLLAPSANGVVLVVEAGRTRREEVRNSVRTIEMVNARLLGCVLNKRRYPVPDWIYRRI